MPEPSEDYWLQKGGDQEEEDRENKGPKQEGKKRKKGKKAKQAKMLKVGKPQEAKKVGTVRTANRLKKKKTLGKKNKATKNVEAQPKVDTEIITGMPEPVPSLHCARCRQPVDPARAIVTGKACGVWRCSKCNTKAVQLNRLPGWKGFSKKLKDLDPDERVSFWKESHEHNAQSLQKFLREKIVSSHTEVTEASKEGEYLPLSVYKKRGFDWMRIRDNCKDYREHPILGRVFKVVIEGSAERSADERKNEKAFEKNSEVDQQTAAEGSGNKEKDKGKDKDRSKGKEKEPTDTAGSSAQDVKKMKNLATRILAKLATILVPLRVTLKHKGVAKLPDFAVSCAKSLLSELEAMESNSEKTIRGTANLAYSLDNANEIVSSLLLAPF